MTILFSPEKGPEWIGAYVSIVIPAKAGSQRFSTCTKVIYWVPAFAGTTRLESVGWIRPA